MIEAYCKQFFGYGRWDAPVWFVGLEEAGAGTPDELQARLSAWDQQLMRMLLLARGEPVEEEALLEYQKHTLGAFSGHACLTELSPLPAPNHLAWPYANRLDLPAWIRNREQFMQTVLPGRAATLREKIALQHPRAVVFYFWTQRQHAEAVAGREFQLLLRGESCGALRDELLGFSRSGTQYFITGHPAAQYPGDPDDYFAELGHHFRQHYGTLFAAQSALAIL